MWYQPSSRPECRSKHRSESERQEGVRDQEEARYEYQACSPIQVPNEASQASWYEEQAYT